jgi:hypothetical protein
MTLGKLIEAVEPCLKLLDDLVAESGRGVEWDEEDPFRMGEWFEREDLAAIERLRAILRVLEGGGDG